MTKYKNLEEFLADLQEPRKSEFYEVRKIILAAEPKLQQQLKWNAPSYFLNHDDRITFNMFNADHVRLVLHAGAKTKEDKNAPPVIQDDSGLLEWNSNIRATITFDDLKQIQTKKDQLTTIIQKWLKHFG